MCSTPSECLSSFKIAFEIVKEVKSGFLRFFIYLLFKLWVCADAPAWAPDAPKPPPNPGPPKPPNPPWLSVCVWADAPAALCDAPKPKNFGFS
jgi:hypothetical protein